ncbi:AraC family transcriptional regulator [Clostridium cellulovorans]|uniref:Transcriptional regulator, AraC family n=1 Tax=Clostridium cellulovorans (strain ATCC 35296 / DSM 3052 / OCM 3 / 743B) TaxID=573061 RepID=D9SR95_CLOC7|nr:AraC family transcriptional regulator [Clostridium cellulovorans]ADL52324.1 transcriptional regulator, AraC family [Clostridium cellulovorans 743B]
MIKVNIGGCNNHHPQNFMIRHMNGSKDYLLLLTKTETSFIIDGKEYETPPGTFVLFDRNVPCSYCNKRGEYVNDWLHFDFVGEAHCFHQLKIPLNRPVILYDIPSISMLISSVINEVYSNGSYKEEVLNHYMHILLYRLSEQIQNGKDTVKSHPMYLKLVDLRSKIYNEPQLSWSIDMMCRELNISQSYFQHLYKNTFHVSSMNDVINARVEQAKFYLLQSVISISTIAEICGYKNEIHFSRQFKKHTGLSPREYREKMIVKKN